MAPQVRCLVRRRQRQRHVPCTTRLPVAASTVSSGQGRNANQGAESTLAGAGHHAVAECRSRPDARRPSARVAATVSPRRDVRLSARSPRVITRLFVPGEELPSDASRASPLIAAGPGHGRTETRAVMVKDIFARFGYRHPDLPGHRSGRICAGQRPVGRAPEWSPSSSTPAGGLFHRRVLGGGGRPL